MQNKRKRGPGRRFSRRPYAQMEGIGLIRRSGDVMIGKQGNSTTHLIDTELQIGPLQFIMDKRAGFPLQLSRVSSPPLIARLRLTVCNHPLHYAKCFYKERIFFRNLKENW